MQKDTFIQTYIDIETTSVIRKDKNKKLEELFQFLEETHTCLSSEETIEIINELLSRKITIRFPLFKQLIYPNLIEEVEAGNIRAIKVFIHLHQLLINYESYTKDYKYSDVSLILKGLHFAPDDRELLEMYEQKRRSDFLFTLHELPLGILYGMNGASIGECSELLLMIDEYENICFKLQLDRSELTNECKFYYSAYKDFLETYNLYGYENFKSYLEIKGNPYPIK